MPADPLAVPIGEAIERIPRAAVLLWRWKPIPPYRRDWTLPAIRRRIVNRLIAGGGRGPYCHASLLASHDHEATVIEVSQFAGGRAWPLAHAVDKYPGQIDVYEPMRVVAGGAGGEWRPDDAISKAVKIVNSPYGWARVIWTGLRHTWAGRFFMRPRITDTNGDGPPFCSDFVSACLRAGGQDPVPNCSDSMTEPNDLARSLFLRYVFTLVPNGGNQS